MRTTKSVFCAWALACFMVSAMAQAEPGDAKAVAKARKDYAQAMHGHDVGVQNAMRVELSFQLAKSKERAKHKGHRDGVHTHAADNPAS